MIKHFFLVLLVLTFQTSRTQTLDTYADQLYFGMLSTKHDSSISKFLAAYVPAALYKYDGSSGWIAFTSDLVKEPPFIKVVTSYVFDKHPYFDAAFKVGQLAITQKKYAHKEWVDNITDIQLWFTFEHADQAKKAFKKLSDSFSSFPVLKRINSKKGVKKAAFSDPSSDRYYSSIQITLVKDYFAGTKTAKPSNKGFIVTTKPGYRLLVEIGNDL